MIKMDQVSLRIRKAVFMMGGWGLLILIASVINQFFDLNLDYVLYLWGGATLLGIAAQTISLVRGLGLNFGVWMAVIAVGWAFTFYVLKFDNGTHIDLYGDLPGVWLILLGVGHAVTAFHVKKHFLMVAALHIAVGVLLELSARQIVSISFLDSYSILIFGIVAGGSMIVAALPVWYRSNQPAPSPAQVTSASPASGAQ